MNLLLRDCPLATREDVLFEGSYSALHVPPVQLTVVTHGRRSAKSMHESSELRRCCVVTFDCTGTLFEARSSVGTMYKAALLEVAAAPPSPAGPPARSTCSTGASSARGRGSG